MFYRGIKDITIRKDNEHGYPFIWTVHYEDGDTNTHCCLHEEEGWHGWNGVYDFCKFYKSVSGEDIKIIDRRDEGDCCYVSVE